MRAGDQDATVNEGGVSTMGAFRRGVIAGGGAGKRVVSCSADALGRLLRGQRGLARPPSRRPLAVFWELHILTAAGRASLRGTFQIYQRAYIRCFIWTSLTILITRGRQASAHND